MNESLSLEQLRCFVYAVEQGSFSAAARRLGKVQSHVSTQLQNLEMDLNLNLFDRSGKYPQLTEAGQALLPSAKQALAQAKRFALTAESFSRGEERELRIACEEMILPDQLNRLFSEFAERFPHTRINYQQGETRQLMELVMAGKADFALAAANESYPDAIDFMFLGTQKVLTLVSPEHPLANTKVHSIMQLTQHRQLLCTSELDIGRWKLSADVWTGNSTLQLLELASDGLGWINAPPSLAARHLRDGRLVEIDASAAMNAWTLGVDLLWSSDRPKGQGARWFQQQLQLLY